MTTRNFVHFETSAGPRLADVADVDLAAPMLLLEPIPGAAANCLGYFNLDGDAVPVLEFSAAAAGQLPSPDATLLILGAAPERVAVVAQHVYGVIEVSAGACLNWESDNGTTLRTAKVDGAVLQIVPRRGPSL